MGPGFRGVENAGCGNLLVSLTDTIKARNKQAAKEKQYI